MATDPKDNVTADMFIKQASTLTYPEYDIPEEVCPTLVDILSRPRAHNSTEESAFTIWLGEYLTALGHKPTHRALGCFSVEIEKNGKKPTTLFTAHRDTVDPIVNDNTARKKLAYDPVFGHVMLGSDNKVGTCLGADDGAGIWIMLEMIRAKVPGGYLFTRGEERGGLGAQALVSSPIDSKWLQQFEVAVAFDRPRDNEVITHQRGGTRCASDKFGDALALALNNAQSAFSYKKSSGGVYTDTFDFRGLIAECANLGVGYTDQHTARETLDYGHLCALRDAVVILNWDALPVDREAKIEYAQPKHARHSYPYGSWNNGMYDPDAWDDYKLPAPAKKDKKQSNAFKEPEMTVEEDVLATGGLSDWVVICETDPEVAAETVINMAVELTALRAQVAAFKRAIRSH